MYYLVLADVGQEMPSFTFLVEAEDKEKARKKAYKITTDLYPKPDYNFDPDVRVSEVATIEDIDRVIGE